MSIMISILVIIVWTVAMGLRPQWVRTWQRRVFAAAVIATAMLPVAMERWPMLVPTLLWPVLVAGWYAYAWIVVEVLQAVEPASAPTPAPPQPQPNIRNRVYPHATRTHVYAQRADRYAGYRKVNRP